MREKNGFALIVTLFTIAVFSFLVLLGYNIVVSERKIASSQKGSVQAYYVTESGVREAIWKLEHDEAWGQNLVDGTLDETLQHSNTVMPDSSYSVSVESIEPGRAQIEAIGYKEQARGTARRVVRVAVTRAIGDSGQNILGQDAFFSGGNITVNGNGT
ncbi:MAG TPA: pilus assembly PilX N-terminal domain-containing protein, partial [Patescibacteria group bacterium]|nr:pilus assembly PilX N-terminal domain-containing protein [Patescibacteria group bacterium]